MPYKVFISHSIQDVKLVTALSQIMAKFGVEPFVAEWYLSPGQKIDKKIFTQIEQADCVIVLLTSKGIRSNWVHQEVGYAKSSHKIIIPLVEKGIDKRYLASLVGVEYIEYDPHLPMDALLKTSIYVKDLKLKKEDREKALIIAGGIMAFLLLISSNNK